MSFRRTQHVDEVTHQKGNTAMAKLDTNMHIRSSCRKKRNRLKSQYPCVLYAPSLYIYVLAISLSGFFSSCLHHQSFDPLSMPLAPPDPLLQPLDYSPSYLPYTTPATIAYSKAATDMATTFPLVLHALALDAPLLSTPCGVSGPGFRD
jgi:hypothetical protein